LVRNPDANVIQATIDAIQAVGGFPSLSPGVDIMLRPNAIDVGPPGSANPDVIRGVIRAIRAQVTPGNIVVADDTFTGATIDRMENNGIADAARDEGATPIGLEGGDTMTDAPPAEATNWSAGMPFYLAVINTPYVINIPVCKTHGSANFSMALKAWYGNVPRNGRNQNHRNPDIIGATMPEMHLVKREDFVVLDATECLLNNGPQVGRNDPTASPGIVVATPDAIAADVTGWCILMHYIEQTGTVNDTRIPVARPEEGYPTVWDQPQIARGMQLASLGWLTSPQNFPFAAVGVDEAAAIMACRDYEWVEA
jgi:uncharacterized protein (DUF362 family)